MILLIDIGNSQIKWQESHSFTDFPRSFSYDAENLASQLETNLKDLSPNNMGVVIVSVGQEEINREIERWFREQLGVGVRFLSSATEWKTLQNGYDKPQKLGVDRWYALVGAASRYSYPFMVCDIGSALTIDLVDAQGAHLGGFISPGLDMMIGSLNNETRISIGATPLKSEGLVIPTNTLTAVREGCMQSIVSLIDAVKRKHAAESICILTGGGAEAIHGLLESKSTVDKNLIFYGMLSEI